MVFKTVAPHRSLSYSVYEAARALNVRAVYNNKSEVGSNSKASKELCRGWIFTQVAFSSYCCHCYRLFRDRTSGSLAT